MLTKYERAYGKGGRRGDAVRRMRCITQSTRLGRRFKCPGLVQASHVSARGMGGVKGDSRSLVPHCASCHDWYGKNPSGYQLATGLHLLHEARVIAVELDKRFGPEPCYQCEGIDRHSPMCKTMEALRERREGEQR
jgi:hypothetical protein